jgi:hypothetical protein
MNLNKWKNDWAERGQVKEFEKTKEITFLN